MVSTRGKTIIIIPARMASKRLPGKPLLEAGGISLLRWTHNKACSADIDYVLVSTPDRAIANHCEKYNLKWMPTSLTCRNGTQRCADIVERFRDGTDVDVVVNWQVDEVEMDAEVVERVADFARRYQRITTVVAGLSPGEMDNPNVTKAICFRRDGFGFDIQWFSRAPMAGAMGHVGIYAYPIGVLKEIGPCVPSAFAEAESLEQLTWLEDGYPISAMRIEEMPLSINTPEDLEEFKRKVE